MDFIGLILSIDIHQHYLATGKSAGGTLTYRRAFSINVSLGLVSCLRFFSSLLLLFGVVCCHRYYISRSPCTCWLRGEARNNENKVFPP